MFANRKYKMFWIVSLPRKWSIRKMDDSGNTECSTELSSSADFRSRPNGFSTMTRACSAIR